MKSLVVSLLALALTSASCGETADKTVTETHNPAKANTAKMGAKRLVGEAFARWQMSSTKACPADAAELAKPIGARSTDPWGNSYVVHCGANAPPSGRIAVVSSGPDGKPGTDDDIAVSDR